MLVLTVICGGLTGLTIEEVMAPEPTTPLAPNDELTPLGDRAQAGGHRGVWGH